jgi:hypothetical protein
MVGAVMPAGRDAPAPWGCASGEEAGPPAPRGHALASGRDAPAPCGCAAGEEAGLWPRVAMRWPRGETPRLRWGRRPRRPGPTPPPTGSGKRWGSSRHLTSFES